MTTFAFVIDNRKCIGCHACTVACKSEHQVPIGVDRTWVKYIEKGEFPNNRRLFSVMRCNHCDRAPCVTICPVTALFRRDDGIVDFNNERCIGCKACMQACPYDALYIDPATQTAAKCNYCTHRLEVGLEPSCVVVCPEQAIIAGDLDNPHSKIAQLVDRHPVQVRKPEKGTQPKLYYIDGDNASLVPSRTSVDTQYVWSSSQDPARDGFAMPEMSNVDYSQPRRTYDVRPRTPMWGWPVGAYTWTKSLASGSLLAAAVAHLTSRGQPSDLSRLDLSLALAGLIFLTLTAALLVLDLKQPRRFLYVLLRPQWGSWLVRGAYALVAYGAVLAAWWMCLLMRWDSLAVVFLISGVPLAVLAAVYTAFLFAQAKGRDFWQSPLLSLHLLAHALLSGGVLWLLCNVAMQQDTLVARMVTAAALGFSLLAVVAELWTTHPTEDARRTLALIVRGPWGLWFWLGGMLAGHAIPLLLLASGASWTCVLAGLLVMFGAFVIEMLWVLAPQRIPLS